MLAAVRKFKMHPWHFIWQPLLAATFVVVMLAALGGFGHVTFLGVIGTTSLGSTAFLVFSSPSNKTASIRRMWGGYFISALMGVVFSAVLFILKQKHVDLSQCFCAEIAAALAMAITMFLMAVLNLEHPPAAGLALGLVVEPWTAYTMCEFLLIVVFMALVKIVLRPWLIDLV